MPDTLQRRDRDPVAVEAAVMRKVTWRLVPFLMLLYLVAFLDRVNVGFAALTMNGDAGLSPQVFGTGAAIFFVGYFLFEVPSTVILHKVGARFWIGRVMVTWGLVSAAMTFILGPKSFYALRFLLGLAEAGFFPGVILYLSYWFPARRRAGVTGLFMAAAPVAGVLGAPLSAALLGMDGLLGLKGWQWMFLIEGVPAIGLGVATLWLLTDRPEQARWLDDAERAWLSEIMDRERRATGGSSRHGGTWAALTNPKVLALSLAYLGTSAGLYTVGIWAPLILKGFGLSTMAIGLWVTVPSLVATVGMVVWSRNADRTGAYHWHAALACLIAAVGMALAARAGTSLGLAVLGLSLGFFGVNAAKPPLWSLPTTFLAGSGAAAGIGLINSLGTLGGSLGPYMVGSAKTDGGYGQGLLFVGGTLVLSAAVTLLLKWAARPVVPAPLPLEEVDL